MKDSERSSMSDLVVRRRAGLMALVALTALGLSAGYLWWFGRNGGGVALLLGVVLGLVAVFHTLAWGDARTPLLVADETGLRVRLGGDWTGIPWSHVERVEVDERGRVQDGHVAVLVAESAGELANARWRSRWGAALNRWFYDAPLVVPFGLTTSVTALDVPATLTRLADGRAPIVVLGGDLEQAEPTVALTEPADVEPVLDQAADRVPGRPAADPAAEPAAEPSDPPADQPVADAAGLEPAQPTKPRKLRSPLIAVREAAPPLPLAKVVAALRSHPARREEVTLPVRREPLTDGTLALSTPYPEEVTEPLPELEHLRRRDDQRPESRRDDGPVNNVGLIIDATTDLSARAMSRVRRAAPLAASSELTHVGDSGDPPAAKSQDDLVIGGMVQQARARLGLTVDELAERTRIRPYVIESIEVDDFGPCGGDFYARGHLRMLARILGLDPDPLLTAYDDGFAASPIDPRAVFDAELSTGATGMIRGGASGANWGGLIAAVLVLVLIWGVAKYFADGTAVAPATARPTQNAAGLGSPGPGNKPLPTPAPATATVRLAAVGGDSRVVVRNRRGKVVFGGMLRDGEVHMSRGIAPLHVMATDGGVVRIGTQGRSLGFLGQSGEKARQVISAAPSN